jgi:hypothetical protein
MPNLKIKYLLFGNINEDCGRALKSHLKSSKHQFPLHFKGHEKEKK